MKTAIITQPLMENYGGILQNYALQQVLIDLGHEPVTIDWLPTLELKWYLRGIRRTLFMGIPYRRLLKSRSTLFSGFIEENIRKTRVVRVYRKGLLRGMDAVIVGSDQVWRYIYNKHSVRDMFLGFAGGFKGRRIAYAASFGLDYWDVPERLQSRCVRLARKFDRISVREESGIRLCMEHFGMEAVRMPDPIFLLPAEKYLDLCKDIPKSDEDFMAAYVLDNDPASETQVLQLQESFNLPVRRCSWGAGATLTVKEWLGMLRDARIVVTDSFHCAVISKLLGKEYRIIENPTRGTARFAQLEAISDFTEERARGREFLKEALS